MALRMEFIEMIFSQNGNEYRFQCSGTILGPQHVLTAAYCFTNRGNWMKLVRTSVWENKRSIKRTTAFDARAKDLQKIYRHRRYKPSRDVHDLAIVHLKEKLGNEVRAVLLPEQCTKKEALVPGEYPGDDFSAVLVTGYGHVENNGTASTHLRQVRLQYRGYRACACFDSAENSAVSNRKDRERRFTSAMKAMPWRTEAHGNEVCVGDGGSPHCFRKVGRPMIQIGVFSDLGPGGKCIVYNQLLCNVLVICKCDPSLRGRGPEDGLDTIDIMGKWKSFIT